MKKISKFLMIFFVAMTVVCNFSFAEPTEVKTTAEDVSETEEVVDSEKSDDEEESNDTKKASNITAEDVENKIDELADKGESLAYKIVEQISDKSLPVCAILVLWGAVLYFILGIRNLYKKRQGLLLMWGAFTFCVIAKIMNFVFWFAMMR